MDDLEQILGLAFILNRISPWSRDRNVSHARGENIRGEAASFLSFGFNVVCGHTGIWHELFLFLQLLWCKHRREQSSRNCRGCPSRDLVGVIGGIAEQRVSSASDLQSCLLYLSSPAVRKRVSDY